MEKDEWIFCSVCGNKTKEINNMNDNKSQIRIYLTFILGICWALGIAAFCLQGNSQNTIYQILQEGFTTFPVIAAVFTRRMTGTDQNGTFLSVYGRTKSYGLSALLLPAF